LYEWSIVNRKINIQKEWHEKNVDCHPRAYRDYSILCAPECLCKIRKKHSVGILLPVTTVVVDTGPGPLIARIFKKLKKLKW
jgi:hypothetical protein